MFSLKELSGVLLLVSYFCSPDHVWLGPRFNSRGSVDLLLEDVYTKYGATFLFHHCSDPLDADCVNIHIACFQAKTKGVQTSVDIGVKYADKHERGFDEEKMKAGHCVIGLQVSVNSLYA